MVLAHKFGISILVQKFGTQKKENRKTPGIPGKLKEFEKNSRNLRKTQENCHQTQGFANSTWFLLPKNVQKISLAYDMIISIGGCDSLDLGDRASSVGGICFT